MEKHEALEVAPNEARHDEADVLADLAVIERFEVASTEAGPLIVEVEAPGAEQLDAEAPVVPFERRVVELLEGAELGGAD